MTQRIPDINDKSMVAARTLCTASGATLWSTHLPGQLPTYRVYDHNRSYVGRMDQRFVNHLLRYCCIQQVDYTTKNGVPVYVYKPTESAAVWYQRQLVKSGKKRNTFAEQCLSAVQGGGL